MAKTLGITDVILRDAHQSLLATRLRTEDMLPIAPKLDEIGFWSLESWGGATFDACIRYLGEDPWERIRLFKKAMPKTPQQMLLRGQNILGYRHYADDVVHAFVERAAFNGIDVFRIFDAMNDLRNLETAIKAVVACDKHAQGTLSYTVSPVHTIDMWVDFAKSLEDMGCHSVCIKDMAGLLKPYVAENLVRRLKESLDIPVHMQCHATTGLSTATIVKAVEAGIDNVDTAISSMSMTYGHSSTEAIIAIFQDTEYDTGLNIEALEEISAYFREIRKKYHRFEGNLKGTDSRILISQVPGGMLTNMENQLKEQNAEDKFDQVLKEIPRVRKDLGYIPLVTPTSQIVGTQSVINVLSGERYKTITKETRGVLAGEYGATPTEVNKELQLQALGDKEPITCRPADILQDEMDNLQNELQHICAEKKITQIGDTIEDVLTYALFPQVAIHYFSHRDDPDAFESKPDETPHHLVKDTSKAPASYQVTVNNVAYQVQVSSVGEVMSINGNDVPKINTSNTIVQEQPVAVDNSTSSAKNVIIVSAPMAGNIVSIKVKPAQQVQEGEVIMVMEAMKMEMDIRSSGTGIVQDIAVKEGDVVGVGDNLVKLEG